MINREICQNLYLICKGIGAGTCAIVVYQQDMPDELIGVDGHTQIARYLAPVGKAWEIRPLGGCCTA